MKLAKTENYVNTKKFTNVVIPKVVKVEKTYNIMNDKDKVKLIKTVERIVRRSTEYKMFIRYLKEEIDMTVCSFFNKVTNKDSNKISIEIHHEPFTLFDITQIVVDKFIDNEEELNPLLIAEEVMKLHYMGMVGLIPLSITVHQLVHDGNLFIPLQNVYGNYVEFVEEYQDYITNDMQSILQAKIKMSKELQNLDLSLLETKYVYLEVDGFTLPQMVTR